MTATTLDPTDVARTQPGRVDPGFGAAFAAELMKLRTARSARRNLVLGLVLGIAASVLLAFVVGATFDDWPAADRAEFDPILFPLTGSLFTGIFFAAVGVNVVASEYATGMMRLTLTATPRRGRVLAAKVLTVVLVTGVASLVAVAAMVGLSQLVFATSDLDTVRLSDGDLWRTVLAMAATGPVFPIIAVCVTVLLRSTAASLSTVLALIFAPSIVGELLPAWWQRNVLSLFPGPASDSLAIGHLSESPSHLHPVAAIVVVIAWAAGLWALAHLTLSRRDA